VVPCGVRLSEVGFSKFRKPQVAGSIPVAAPVSQQLTRLGLGQEEGVDTSEVQKFASPYRQAA
jgi:hypothetical protein